MTVKEDLKRLRIGSSRPDVKINETQRTALVLLAANGGRSFTVGSGTVAFLRKRGLVGKVTEKPCAANGMRQTTTSPLTNEGRRIIGLPVDDGPCDCGWVEKPNRERAQSLHGEGCAARRPTNEP